MGTSAICCPVVGLTTLSIGVVSAEIPMLLFYSLLGRKQLWALARGPDQGS
jgi:hypothetical protein